MSWFVDLLATYRLTRLASADKLFEHHRARLVAWSEVEPETTVRGRVGQLIRCRWCTSVWIGFGVVAARRVLPRAWQPVAAALALSAATGLLSELEDALWAQSVEAEADEPSPATGSARPDDETLTW